MIYCELADAVSVTGCDGAATVTVSSVEKLLCKSFTAYIEDWEKHATDAAQAYLVTTNKLVTVWHKFTDPMTADQKLTIGRLPDGRWVTVVWPCDS